MKFTKVIFQKIFRIFFKKNVHSEQNFVKLEKGSCYSEELRRKFAWLSYIPPSFKERKRRKFPVLFIHDAQDMEAVKMQHTLEQLFREKKLPEIFVFAFFPGTRMQEYGTYNRLDYAGRGKLTNAYQDFLTQTLIPDLESSFPLSQEPAQRAIAGFSLGGLAAFDLAFNNPHLFGNVGVFSGSFWWRSKKFKEEDPDADRIVHNYVESTADFPNSLRYWLQTGTEDEKEDRNNNGIIDSIDDTTDLIKILKFKGVAVEDIKYVEVEGGEHNPQTWAQVLPDFLVWTFGKAVKN